jgi:exodeoxyribonuclease VII large subunit
MSKIFKRWTPTYPDDEGSNARLLAEAKAGSNAPALSVSEISNALKRTVEDRFGHVRVRGELSGVKRAASGHLYFSLKDADAKLDGVMWKGHAGRLSFAPEDGLEIIATGKLTTYAGRSSYQIVADRIELAGEGALMMLFEKLKARLAAEGLFDTARKRPIPYLPRTIGIVTSPTGAVIRDMMHRLEARFPSHVVLWPVLVQGDNAAAQIAAAIRGFADMSTDGPVRRPDLLIVARGGGSIEDLWAFNEEPVVRAVADCPIPVISAVGHETDTTLCDYAADLRAPTPSAAAEMAVPVRLDLAQRIAEAQLRLAGALRRFVERARDRLATQERLLPSAQDIIAERQQRADELGEKLRRGLERRSDIARIAYVGVSARLNPALLRRPLDRQRDRLEAGPAEPCLAGTKARRWPVAAVRFRQVADHIASGSATASGLCPGDDAYRRNHCRQPDGVAGPDAADQIPRRLGRCRRFRNRTSGPRDRPAAQAG